jgi:hypothetical protein
MEQHVSTTVSTGPLCHTASRHPTVMGTTKSRKNSLRRFIAVQFHDKTPDESSFTISRDRHRLFYTRNYHIIVNNE